jgi:hypothetical protein
VYGVWWDGLAFSDVASALSMGPMQITAQWVKTVWVVFQETGDVESRQGQRVAPPANLIVDHAAAHALVQQLLDSPDATLNEHKAEFESSTGKAIHISTFCVSARGPPAARSAAGLRVTPERVKPPTRSISIDLSPTRLVRGSPSERELSIAATLICA